MVGAEGAQGPALHDTGRSPAGPDRPGWVGYWSDRAGSAPAVGKSRLMPWIEAIPAVLAAIVALAVTGAPIALSLGLRGRIAVATTPLLAVSVVSVAATATAALKGAYGIPLVLVTTAALAAIAFGVRKLLLSVIPASARAIERVEHGAPSARRANLAFTAALVVASLLIGARLVAIFDQPSNISQTFDNIYHLNAVRYLLETGDASPLTFSSSTYAFDGQGSFYPAAWHAFTGLVALVSGASIPVAVNAVSLVVSALVWPLGLLVLSRVVLGDRVLGALAVGALAPALGAFPYLMVDFGVLYPNLLSIALLPASIALGVIACRAGRVPAVDPAVAWLAFAAGLPGLALAHPSTLIALVIIATPPVLSVAWRRGRGLARAGRRRALAVHVALLAAAGAVGFALIWFARPPSEAAFWPPQLGPAEALFSAVTLATGDTAPNFVYAVLWILGCVALLRWRRHRWLIVSHLIMSALWAVALAAPMGLLRYGFVGTWYSDENRLEALLPVTGIPLAAAGALLVIDLAVRAVSQRRSRADGSAAQSPAPSEEAPRGRAATTIVAGALTLLVIATQLAPSLALRTEEATIEYAMTADARLLSPDEEELLQRVDEHIPDGGVVIGNPWTGTSLVYAYAGRLALLPAIYGDRSPETLLLLESLREAEPGSVECEAIEAEGVTHVLDFGRREVHDGRHPYPGIERLTTSDAVELVDEEGKARLYAVTACDD